MIGSFLFKMDKLKELSEAFKIMAKTAERSSKEFTKIYMAERHIHDKSWAPKIGDIVCVGIYIGEIAEITPEGHASFVPGSSVRRLSLSHGPDILSAKFFVSQCKKPSPEELYVYETSKGI